MILEKSYPAYRFVAEDDVKSLSELQLTPTAIVIVKQLTVSYHVYPLGSLLLWLSCRPHHGHI